MKIIETKILNGGTVIGKVYKLEDRPTIEKKQAISVEDEINRLQDALDEVKADFEKIIAQMHGTHKEIMQAQYMLLCDDGLISRIKSIIENEKVCAQYACIAAGEYLSEEFKQMDDEYFKARIDDIIQMSEKLADAIIGYSYYPKLSEKVILAADSFTPDLLSKIDRSAVIGLISTKGNPISHTAILAADYGFPYVAKVNMNELNSGDIVIIDEDNSRVIISPDSECIGMIKEKMNIEISDVVLNGESSTVKIYANISSAEDVDETLTGIADGIGLFRTEYLFMNRNVPPTEEEQYEIYRSILQKMGDKEVIIRTIDGGFEKKISCMNIPDTPNPALGYRGIRISFLNVEQFRIQLKALLRAAVYGNLSIMFPMITSEKEILDIREQINICKKELSQAGMDYVIPKIGIMVETPAAALISSRLGKLVDFFSIGTNDLTQYTYAIDRQSESLCDNYSQDNEAVLMLIKMIVNAAKECGISVSVCGQLAAETSSIPEFLDYGVDKLSVPAKLVSQVKRKVVNL